MTQFSFRAGGTVEMKCLHYRIIFQLSLCSCFETICIEALYK